MGPGKQQVFRVLQMTNRGTAEKRNEGADGESKKVDNAKIAAKGQDLASRMCARL